jgi:Cu-Zn family superoxide dismutase
MTKTPALAALALVAAFGATALTQNASFAQEGEVVVDMHLVSANGMGDPLGTITMKDGKSGLNLAVNFANTLSPGPHGFHLHENGSCEAMEKDGQMVAALGAGGHYDPSGSGSHQGPSGEGHLGDLPILFVQIDEDGATATKHTLVAPRLTLADAPGRAIVIHANGDNFRDEPNPLGGGGARVACGVVPAS